MKFGKTLLVLLLAGASAQAMAKPATPAKSAPAAVALPSLDIPATKIVLKNGLTVIVHEDHKAPIVAVNIWYHVGSKNEPAGRTGFAHLFEHLMFGGKNGNQKGWFEKMEAVGATDLNGTTNTDRTNFFETVPAGALDMTLYMEAQRMGHLLDGFDEKLLTTQRGVVQNEKRQGDNQPYRIAEDIEVHSTWPAGHPYSHTVIGEMTDLDAAKVDDVKDWFSKYYGPTNATVVLAGDITPAEAKAKMERYFGAIPPGVPVSRQKTWIAKRSGRQFAVAQDRVAQPRLYMVWNTPGWGTADGDYLALLSDVLDSGKSSRLYNRLVYKDQLATSVNAELDDSEVAGQLEITVTAKPGVDLAKVEAIVNEELGRLLKDGPTAAEMQRVRTRRISDRVRQAERVGGFGGKSDILAASQTFGDSPDAWKVSFERDRTAAAADLTAAGRKWLADGVFSLYITPFPEVAADKTVTPVTSAPIPSAAKPAGFAPFKRATLKNGIKVIVAERHDVPLVNVSLVMDAGTASDQFAKPGAASLTAALLSDGTDTLDAPAFSDRLLELGARFNAAAGRDSTFATVSALKVNLDPSLDLFADAVRHPAFRPTDVAREKALRIAAIQQAKRQPGAALRIEPTLVFGPTHPYGVLATEQTVAALTPQDLKAYHDTWIQPGGATLVVVGDTTLDAILPKLEARFGDWKLSNPPTKTVKAPPLASSQTVYLIDKPSAAQSAIAAAEVAPTRLNDPDDLAIEAMNTSLGGAFTSRLNMNLREDKHWSYGASSFVQSSRGAGLFMAFAPVQTDKTVESFTEMKKELADIASGRPISAEELALARNNLTQSLSGQWETSAAVAGSLNEIAGNRLPDDYYATYASRIAALNTADVARAAGRVVHPNAVTWVIVGDRAKVEPGLKALGLAIHHIDADGKSLD
jgi:predicted Zn-dependent peptidase